MKSTINTYFSLIQINNEELSDDSTFFRLNQQMSYLINKEMYNGMPKIVEFNCKKKYDIKKPLKNIPYDYYKGEDEA